MALICNLFPGNEGVQTSDERYTLILIGYCDADGVFNGHTIRANEKVSRSELVRGNPRKGQTFSPKRRKPH